MTARAPGGAAGGSLASREVDGPASSLFPDEVIVTDSRAPLPLQSRSGRPGPGTASSATVRASLDPDAAHLHVRWSHGSAVVVVSGELDVACCAPLAAVGRLLGEWAQPPVVDAAGVEFIDLTGLGALCSLSRAGEPVRVLRPSASVLRLLRVLALAGWSPTVRALRGQDHAVLLLPAGPSGASG